ncbi:MAG: carbohydrate ABC transporter permease [Spirochaetaceae bacterium]|nr:MAG: carbohydrate ABC transporter permease [Spirochaetaceae bacterium]
MADSLVIQKRKLRPEEITSKVLLNLSVVAIVVIWTIPTFGLLISSFRTPEAINSTGWWTAVFHPFSQGFWTLGNYLRVLTEDQMGTAFANSLLVTIPATVIPITIAAFAAYGLAWMNFLGRRLLFILVVGLMVVPLQTSLLPLFRLYNDTGLAGTYLGIWLAHTGFGLPLATYLLYGYISQIPRELIEASEVDGTTPMTKFIYLVLPVSVPAIASFAIFQFLWVWNDLLVALIFLGTRVDVAVVTTRLSELVGSRGQAWYVLTAGAFLSMIMPLIVFFALQRYFVRGMMAGSVKG